MSQPVLNKPFEQPFKNITIVAGADLTEKRYRFVNFDPATGKGVIATAAAHSIGVLQQPGALDTVLPVANQGIVFFHCEDAIKPGENIEVGTDGKGKKATTGTVVAICVVGGAAGEIGCCLLK